MSSIPINNNLRLQSPYLYCQAVGSDGSDNTKGGIHLRWDLTKELGDNHIPKGYLAGSNVGYNKPDDFVTLYRSPFNDERPTIIDFQNLDASNMSFLPEDEGIIYSVTTGWGGTNNIIVRFLNRAKFKLILDKGIEPITAVQDFLHLYNDIIEVEVQDKLMFKYEMNFAAENESLTANFETVSIKDRLDNNSVYVIKREYLLYEHLKDVRTTIGENIKYIRLSQNGLVPVLTLTLYTYEDIFKYYQETSSWETIGNFGLSLNDSEVFTWFQGDLYQGGGTLDLNWPKYNNGVMLVGDNYLDRWGNKDDGLKELIQQFIPLSNIEPRANQLLNTSDDPENPNGLTVSLLDMLKIVGIDYHGARMMGLGFLDAYPFLEGPGPFIYAAVYTTYPDLPEIGTDNDHVFLTIPTSTTDYRLPSIPVLNHVSYGLYVSSEENNEPELISNPDGYSLYDDSRFINLRKQNTNAPQPIGVLIPENDAFDATQVTQPAGFGIEYRHKDDGDWRQPELIKDNEYLGSDNQYESMIIPEKDMNPIYTHNETEPGIHLYALYPVNWFSRVNGESNIVETDETFFPKHNRLLPPSNLAVQYIQEEDPLILTSASEQNTLNNLNASDPDGDHYRTRVVFDWDNIHHNAYQSANKIEFFYRESPFIKIEGQIKSVVALPGTDAECLILTKPFTMASQSPVVVITPSISLSEIPLFIGSTLNTQEGQFTVLEVSQPYVGQEGPSFRVKKLVANEALQAESDDPVIIMPVYTAPKKDDVFFIFENTNTYNGWTKLNQSVNLIEFSNETETIYEEDGSSHTEVIGGIHGDAFIEELPDGGYAITFLSSYLTPPTDAFVSWVKGSARFTLAGFTNKKKRLPVVSLQQTNPIKIVVFDPDYFTLPNERILTGTQSVNYHPSYKVYLTPQPGVFDKTKTMPLGNINNKKTYLAVRSIDTTLQNYSSLTNPAVLVAKNVQKPLPPQSINGPLFATRPDFYGKSTYTLDIQLDIADRVPFGLVVYRANEMSILQTLYNPDTFKQVILDLAAIADNDPQKFDRWRSLVEVETEIANDNQFRLFGAYRFPNPDNDSTEIFTSALTTSIIHPFPLLPGETLLSKKTIIKKAIEDIFAPITETPLIFEYLKTGYQTSSKEPTIKSAIGRWLEPSNTSFDPYPMAVKFPVSEPNTVRITDYTLSGNSRNIYFYFAREIALEGKLSERTPVSGPVVLVDAAPAEKPNIRKVITIEADPILNTPPSIRFELTEYLSTERINEYQIYRTTNIANATSVRNMELAATVQVGNPIIDIFSGLDFPPFGLPLFYRVVALRKIINEKQGVEMIPSIASEMVLTNVIDVLNPIAPVISYTAEEYFLDQNGNIQELFNVTLSWPRTVYNGTYFLYKMNDKGNWTMLWSKKTNDVLISFPENGDFNNYPEMESVEKIDNLGNPIYHRFKVSVENANGLFNLEDKELVI